jgi:hypothetical protein
LRVEGTEHQNLKPEPKSCGDIAWQCDLARLTIHSIYANRLPDIAKAIVAPAPCGRLGTNRMRGRWSRTGILDRPVGHRGGPEADRATRGTPLFGPGAGTGRSLLWRGHDLKRGTLRVPARTAA